MRLSCVSIKNFSNINDFQYSSQWTIRATDPNTLYFQVVDLDKTTGLPNSAPVNAGFGGVMSSYPQRYISGIGGSNQPASVTVTFPSLDPTQTVVVSATQDSNDGSIWNVLLSGIISPSSGNVQFQITEGSTTRVFSVPNMISVEQLNAGSC